MRGLFLGAVFGLVFHQVQAQSPSVLTLERSSAGKSPFQKGDRLEIRDACPPVETARSIIILNVQWWPWVEVQTLTGKNWINFSNVTVARLAKPGE